MGRHYGKQVRLTTGAFAGVLSGADDDVQKALDTIDDHAHGGVYMPLAGGTFTGDVLFQNGEQCRFRQTSEYFSSDAAGYLDAHATTAFRLTTAGVVSLTSPGNGVLQVAGDLWAIDSGGNPRVVLGDATTGGNWGSIRWVSASDSIGIGTDTGGVDTLLISEAGNVLLAGTGQFQFGDAAQYIHRSAASVLSYVTDGRHEFTGGPVYVGSGSPGHTITGSGDLYVADRVEVDGPAYFDDQTYFYGLMDCRDQHIMSFYGSTFGGLYRVGGDGLHFYVYGGAGTVQNRNLIICDYDARADDYDHSAISADPHLFIQSDTRAGVATDEWVSFCHDQTDALYNVGSGTHKFGQTVDVTGDIAVSGTVDGVDVAGLKSDFDAHAHGDLYYTETEIDTWRAGVTVTEMGYLDGVTSDIQTQFGTKLENITAEDLSDLANVNAAAPDNLDNLSWDTGTSRWIPRAPGAPGAHDLGGASHNADTLANLNGKISDATLEGTESLAHIYVYRTATYDMAANNTWYDLLWNIAAPVKVNVTHDHTSNPEQITLPEAGKYQVSFTVQVLGSVGYVDVVRLLDDGTEIAGSYRQAVRGGASRPENITGVVLFDAAATSVIELQVGTNQAGADVGYYDDGNLPDPTTFVCAAMSITRIGP